MPDLTKVLGEAAPTVQRQVFEVFELQILYDKAERKVEISATVSEAVASAFEKQKALLKEGSLVVLREVAGARFVPSRVFGWWSLCRSTSSGGWSLSPRSRHAWW